MTGYGIKDSLGDAMLDSLASQREYLYPRMEELKPGQVIWLARSTEYKPRWGESTADYLQPVVITLYTPKELGQPPGSKERLKKNENRAFSSYYLRSLAAKWSLHHGRSRNAFKSFFCIYPRSFGYI